MGKVHTGEPEHAAEMRIWLCVLLRTFSKWNSFGAAAVKWFQIQTHGDGAAIRHKGGQMGN